MSFLNIIIEDAIKYNLDNEIPLTECVFRRESEKFSEYFSYLKENKNKFIDKLDEFDKELLNTDIGEAALFEDKKIFLDIPFITEDTDPELNTPKRNTTGKKKYVVYVKNDKGNIQKIEFGDEKGGLTAKINNPEARKNFSARHNCPDKTDKTKAGYWACRLPYYAKQLGLSDGGKYYW